jgi:DNA polymerase-1
MSSSKPNMQQAPSTEQYRKMFVAKPGWKLVDSDYSSAELFIAAYLSGDKQLLFAIEQGYDLHSYSSFLIFGQKWLDAGEVLSLLENHLLKKLQTLEKV